MKLSLLGMALTPLLVFSSAPSSDASPAADSALVVIESPVVGTIRDLLDRGVDVVWNGGDFLLAVIDPEEIAGLRTDDVDAREIDPTTRGGTYYVVSPVPADRERDLAARSRLLWSRRGHAVIDVSEERLHHVLDAGFEVARVFLYPVRSPRDMTPLPRYERGELDPAIEAMVDSVSNARIDAHVQRLENFGTRYAPTDSAWAAAEYLRNEFASYGIDSVAVHDWSNGTYAPNVVAVLPGLARPDELVVVGAHYDSYAEPNANDAPGADDNASGTALVLESARVMGGEEYARTIVFIAFGAEELGLVGSHAWVQEVAIAGGLDIVAMLNADMIGYSESTELDMTLVSEPLYTELRDLMIDVGATYVPTLPLEDGLIPGGTSDHASFWQGGFHAIMFFEDSDSPSPYIHTNRDDVGQSYNAPLLAYQTVQLGVAFLATVADPLRLAIVHEPLSDTENTVTPYRVAARLSSPYALDPDSLLVRYAVDDVAAELPLVPTGTPDEYEAFIPAQPGGRFVDYHLVAADEEGGRITDPENAPHDTHTFFVGVITHVLEDDFETSTGWRARVPGDDATSGIWILDDPVATGTGFGAPVQPEYDHTPGDEAVLCYVTGNAPPGVPVGQEDVDGGRTTLESPVIDLTDLPNARLTYFRWFSNSANATSGTDEWVVNVSPDNGATWVELERLAENSRQWEKVERELGDFIPFTNEVRLRFIASDEGGEDIVEAALDDVSVRAYEDPATPIDPDAPEELPPGPRLVTIVPNPYGAFEGIRLNVPAPARPVSLRIYDVAGRRLKTLVDEPALVGVHTLRWDGRDEEGRTAPSGTYFARIRAGTETISARFVLVH